MPLDWRASRLLTNFHTVLSVALALVVFGLAGCAAPPPAPAPVNPGERAYEFSAGVDAIAADLIAQLQQHAARTAPQGVAAVVSRLQGPAPVRQAVIDPFIDAQNGYGTRTTQRAQEELVTRLGERDPTIRVAALTSGNLDASAYVVTGALSYEAGSGAAAAAGAAPRQYRLITSVSDARSGSVIASSSAWIADRNLDMAPLPSFADSPVFLNDSYAKGQLTTARATPGTMADTVWFSRLSTAALLADAQAAFAADDHRGALGLYQRAEARSDGKILKVYSGLYVTHLKLGNVADAERTFGQLVALALAENNLSIRFLFRVNSTDFVADSHLVEQYRLWVRQLAAQLARARTCVDVQGHSSKSGSEEYNDKLSLERAMALRRQLQAEAPALAPLLRASGRGSRENLVGSGSDDARDAIDRRVEFRIISCVQPR
ncbi:MAG: OmpA family protein [Burkholderiaceae bacterium]|nr:OmpA family protein [Burkholderiaceae bacterium]